LLFIRPNLRFLAGLCLALLVLCPLASAEQKVTRILYANDSMLLDKDGKPLKGEALSERMQLLRDAYGTELFVIDYVNEGPPEKPVKLEGIVLHNDSTPKTGDQMWVVGDRNPSLDFRRVRKQVSSRWKSIKDLDEKYDGYRFIEKVVPDNGAPKMKLGSAFTRGALSEEVTASVEAHVDETLRKYGVDPAAAKELRGKAVRIGKIRERINQDLGTSFVKVRDLNHSEGKLPKSDKDWVDLFVYYTLNVKAKVLEAERKADEEGASLPELLVEIDRVEGRVLDVFLENPSNIIAQKKAALHRETRLHFIEGKVMPDSVFLRFYQMNEYLPRHEKKALESFMRDVFSPGLVNAGIDPAKFSMTPDLVIVKEPGLEEALAKAKRGDYAALYPFIRVLDENVDMQSGYLYPQEDLFTTGQYGLLFSGKKSRFLEEFEEYKQLPVGKKRSARLGEILKKYAAFMTGDVAQAFWDRVISHDMELLAENPSPELLDAMLTEMRQAKQEVESIYMQLIHEAQDLSPKLRLPAHRARYWQEFLNDLDPEVDTFIDEDGRLYDKEIVNPITCKAYKELIRPNH
jgi:hypothetical protein